MLTALTDDVAWANGMDGGYVHGREAVREYWTRQWTMVSPHVEPVGFHRTADGAIIAEVRQSVRDLKANRSRGRRTGLKTRRSDTFSVSETARWLASTSGMLPRDPDLVSAGPSQHRERWLLPRCFWVLTWLRVEPEYSLAPRGRPVMEF